jgi:hypothetical protein
VIEFAIDSASTRAAGPLAPDCLDQPHRGLQLASGNVGRCALAISETDVLPIGANPEVQAD